MPLIRVTARKLAANRANAQKSTGPRSAAGKAASARNAAVHYLYARKLNLPTEWHDEFTLRALQLTEPFSDPLERALRHQWVYLELWIQRLDSLESSLCLHHIRAANNDSRRGSATWVLHSPLFRAWLRRFRQLTRRAARLFHQISQLRRSPAPSRAAAAPHRPPSAEQTHISFIPITRGIYSESLAPLLPSQHQPRWAFSL